MKPALRSNTARKH